MKKILLFLLLTFVLFERSKAQSINHIIDSLQNELSKTIHDTTRIKILDQLSLRYSKLDPDKGLQYAREGESLANKVNSKTGLASFYTDYGSNYTSKCDYKNALKYNFLALEMYREMGNLNAQGGLMANICVVYLNQSDYARAMEYAFNALKLLEDGNDLKTIAAVQENIGSIYLEQKNFPKTLYYFSLAYTNNEKIKDKAAMARNMANKGIVLNEKGEYSEALKCHENALKLNQARGAKRLVQINLANIGNTYGRLKNYQKALWYHLKALEISRELKDQKSNGINIGNVGEIYLELAKNSSDEKAADQYLDNATDYLKRATDICKEINFKGPFAEFNSYLSEAYSLSRNHQLALATYKEYIKTRDFIFTLETKLKIASLESKRLMDLKDRDIMLKNQNIQITLLESINRKNQTIIYLIGIALLITIIFTMYIIFRIRSKAHKNTLLEIATIQSHEVRAPLARILGLVMLFDQNNMAEDNHRQILNYIHSSALELDEVIRKIVNKTSECYLPRKSWWNKKPSLVIR
ncbi:MAG: tetratricopeptide repeat protein [Bacteroidia bacterium]